MQKYAYCKSMFILQGIEFDSLSWYTRVAFYQTKLNLVNIYWPNLSTLENKSPDNSMNVYYVNHRTPTDIPNIN